MAEQIPEQKDRHGVMPIGGLFILLGIVLAVFLPILVFVAFLILKLTSIVSWSWLWTCSPLWLGIPVEALILLVKEKLFD